MFRNLLTLVLAVAVAVFGMEPPLTAQDQYSQAQPQYPPAQQQYPAPQYGQPQQYPQYGQGQQDAGAPDVAQDQQHGVGRISIVQGDVNVKRGDSGDLVAAVMNAPLMTQDHLQTSQGSRAEVELDSANLIRLAPNTDVGFADLEYHKYQVQLGAGTMIYRVLRDSNAQTEVDTPSIAVRPVGQGEFRISVLDDGTTQIAVRSGEVEIFSPRGSQRVQPGHSILVRGNPSDPEFQNTYELARDQFDDWSAMRDRELLASQSYQHVSSDIYGADDLDAYGNWVPSQYGQVWAPQPPVADWSPYSYGQWTWENYYGWTWVDSAPWGWAPYHYGRWFWNTGYGWCWWPGAGVGMTLWSPALVGFFGWGGFGLGFGGLGWVALAPFEVFHGWWGHGWGHGWDGGWRGGYGGYGRGNVASMYRNAAFRGGAMTAGANGFGRPGQRFSPATRAQLTNATAYHGQIPVSPTRASYQFTNRQATANPRLASAANRQFFQHQQFRSQASPGNVSRGAAAPSAARGFTGNAAVANGSRFGASPQASHGTPPNLQGANAGRNGGATGTGAGGWQRFGQPGTANSFRQGYAGGQETSGWHRFGQPQPSGSGVNGQPRTQTAPNYAGRSMGSGGTSRGNYESRPLGMTAPGASQRPSFSGYGNGSNGAYGGRPAYNAPRSSAPAMPHYNAPAPQHYSAPAPHYSAPAAPHYSAPSSRGGGGGGSHGGGGGGGGHSSSGGHHGR